MPASDNAGVDGAIVIVAVLNGGVIVIEVAVHIEDWVPDVPDGACCDKLKTYATDRYAEEGAYR